MTRINTITAKVLYPELSYRLTGVCFRAQKKLGRFARERQYADEVAQQLTAAGIPFDREVRLTKFSPASPEGNIVDFLIEGTIVLDLKAKPFIQKDDYQQMQRYLQAAYLELGMIVNFRSFFLKPKRVLNPQYSEHSDVNSDRSDRGRGFTLMEILVATGIFSGVLVAGTAFYATTLRNAEKNRLNRELSQVGRTLVEEIEREFRSSQGSFNAHGRRVREAFSLEPNPVISLPATSSFCPPNPGGRTSSQLVLYRQIDNSPRVRQTTYRLERAAHPSETFGVVKRTRESSDFGQSFGTEQVTLLNPESVRLFGADSLCFRGYFPSVGSTSAPYVEIKLMIRNREYFTLPSTRRAEESFQTSVTTRDANVKY